MRNMSFSITLSQFRDRSKTVTRRTGWKGLKPGDIVCGIEKGMGLGKGEKVVRIGKIRVINSRRERIDSIELEDVAREGFPDLSVGEFVKLYCKANKSKPSDHCTRIEFEYVD